MNLQKTLLVGLVAFLPFTTTLRAAESVQDAFRRGLLAEETTRDLKSAAEAYAEAVRLAADQRAIQATALFRLAECQKKLGNTTEASATLQRLGREYPEQRELLARIPELQQSKRPPQIIDPAALPRLRAQLETTVLAYNEKVEEIANLTRRMQQLREYSGVAFAARVPTEYSNPELSRLSSEINTATIRRTGLSPDFGPEHPEVLRVESVLKALNKLMAEQKDAALERIQADLNQRTGQLDRLKATTVQLREEMDAEAFRLKAAANEETTTSVSPAGSMPGPAVIGGDPTSPTTLSEADLRTQIDSLSAELEVLLKLPDALERGRFIVSRHREQTSDQFRSDVGTWSTLPTASRTNDYWRRFESLVQYYMRPIEDRLRFAKMELEVLQKQKAEREPRHVSIFGDVSRPGDLAVEPGQTLTASQAVRMSGGPTVYADLKKVFVRRKTKDGKEETIPVNMDRVLKQGDTSADVDLIEGDKVVVPERKLNF